MAPPSRRRWRRTLTQQPQPPINQHFCYFCYDAYSSLSVEVTFQALLALALMAEAVTSQDRLTTQKLSPNPTTCDFKDASSVVGLLSDPSAMEGGGSVSVGGDPATQHYMKTMGWNILDSRKALELRKTRPTQNRA
jgi:hypothetical protein